MNKLDLRNSGPFTPEEAAKRVKLASKQLKWFTPCHPYWGTAHVNHFWKTTFPLPPLIIPRGVRMTYVGDVEVDFDISQPGNKALATAFKAGPKLAGLAELQIRLHMNRRDDKAAAPNFFRFTLTPTGDWDIEVYASHPKPEIARSSFKRAVAEVQLAGIKGWKLRKEEPITDSEFNLINKFRADQVEKWLPAINDILATQPKPIKTANWGATFKYKKIEEKKAWSGNRYVLERTDGERFGPQSKKPHELLQLVNGTGLPGGKAEVYFSSTVDCIEDFVGIFRLAMICPFTLSNAIGIFETERGKQGLLLFKAKRIGIQLFVMYGENGWEELHQELRKTNGKLQFPKRR